MNKNFNNADLIHYLEAEAELDSFYMLQTEGLMPGLIYYVDRNRNTWILMEDDDLLVEACVRFLMARGNPVFECNQEAAEHEALLKR